MTTDLTKYAGAAQLPADTQALADALGGAVQDNTSGGGAGDAGVDYCDFSGKRGVYNVGKEREDMDPDDLWLIGGPGAFSEGWIFWKNSKVLKRVEWPMIKRASEGIAEQDLPFVAETERSQDGWSSQLGFMALPFDAERETPIKFTTNSVSGRNALGDLVDEVRARLLKGEPCYPVISFNKETFVAQGETNYKPRFDVETWLSTGAAVAWLNGELSAEDALDGVEPAGAEPTDELEEAPQEDVKTSRRVKSRRKSKAA